MSTILCRAMPFGELISLLEQLANDLEYIIQSLYAGLRFERLAEAGVDLPNCLEGRAFGVSGEVTWLPTGADVVRVTLAWDGTLPDSVDLAGWEPLSTPEDLEAQDIEDVYLWGTRRQDDPDRWFSQRTARAELMYPVSVPAGNDGFRVKARIRRYRDPETHDLVFWRLQGLEAVDSPEVLKSNG